VYTKCGQVPIRLQDNTFGESFKTIDTPLHSANEPIVFISGGESSKGLFLELDTPISFHGRTMRIPISYAKDGQLHLMLSTGLCYRMWSVCS